LNIVSIIPARMSASRFPGKPMKKIHGLPMVAHCYFRSSLCKDVSDTYVATCDEEIFDYIESIGGKAIMTSDLHERASDRVAEAMIDIEKQTSKTIDLIVMVQGDEPMITPTMITQAISPFKSDENISVVNLMAKIKSIEEFNDPNEIKVVVDSLSNALYFSRAPIPYSKDGIKELNALKQVCVIPFKRDYLLQYNNTEETPLEIMESVDMMRILENGKNVRMVLTSEESFSVDTEEDRKRVEELMLNDHLMQSYK